MYSLQNTGSFSFRETTEPPTQGLVRALVSEAILDACFAWLCQRRKNYPANADIWWFRKNWPQQKTRIQNDLSAGRYCFNPQARVTRRDGETVAVWSARDSLVLKAMSMVLAPALPASLRCTHLKGHGGHKGAIRAVAKALPDCQFVMRTDVLSFYDSVDHFLLLDRLSAFIDDRPFLNLITQCLRRSITWGGLYRDCKKGLSRANPLSPLLGAFFLYDLDKALERTGLFSIRFMDDILIMAPTRWKLRRGIAVLNQHLERLGLEQHPDKTSIGRIKKGFDFLGYHFNSEGVSVALATLTRFVAQATRLYEQERQNPLDAGSAFGGYVRRWFGWINGGLDAMARLHYNRSNISNDPPSMSVVVI
jgi:RNA-directed DNA polymerase